MKNFIRKNVTKKKVLTLALVMLVMTLMFAQGGATAISNAASDIKDYWDPIKADIKGSRWTRRIYRRIEGVQQMDERRPGCQQRNPRLRRCDDLPYRGSGICNRILCLRWDTTCTRGSKPLVFFGLKGKYIIYAVAVIGAGVVAALILSKFGLLGSLLGLLVTQEVSTSFSRSRTKTDSTTRPKNFDQIFIFPKTQQQKFLKRW